MFTQYLHLIRELGKSFGVQDLTPDEDGACALEVDEQLLLLRFNEKTEEALLVCHLDYMPDEPDSVLYRRLLDHNGSPDGLEYSLVLDPDARSIQLLRSVNVRAQDGASFLALLEHTGREATKWAEDIGAYLDSLENQSPAPDPAAGSQESP